MVGFFKAMWRGDLGLAKTYWLWGVLVGGIGGNIALAALVLLYAVVGGKALALFGAAWIAWVVYAAINAVGIWRAATKHQGNPVWAFLAKLAVVLGIAYTTIHTLTVLGP